MVSAHPHTIDTTRQPPKLGDFFSPYQQQQQQQPSLISNNFDSNSNSNINGYENINNNLMQGHHRPQSVTNLPLRQQNQNNALARQSQQNRRSPLLNATNNSQQFLNQLGRPPPLMSSPTGFLNQENPQLLQNRSNSQNSIPKNPKLYKTELCRSWMDHGRCNYGDRCQYAHGDLEKRQIPRHPKYKTEACSSYHKTGYCPYGPRCHFIHNEDPALLQQLIAQNAAATMGSGDSSPSMTPITQRPRNLNLQQTMSAPPSTVATPQQQQQGQQGQHQPCQRQYSTILPIGSRPSLPQTPQQQQYFVQKQLGSDGESPIPSSTDSGSESPLGSFSPGLEESLCRLSPTSFRRSLSHTATPITRWSPTTGLPIAFSPPTSTPNNNSSAAVAGIGSGGIGSGNGLIFGNNDPWNDSSLINSMSSLSFDHHQLTPTTPSENPWETTSTTKTISPVAAARLPVFERLSNNL